MISSQNSSAPLSLASYEQQIIELKNSFIFNAVEPAWLQKLNSLKSDLNLQQTDFTLDSVSSFYAVPTRELAADERVLHRIWLGDKTPESVNATMNQWQQAIRASHSDFNQTLWVWNIQQLAAEPCFVADYNDPDVLGYLFFTQAQMKVRSLQFLAATHCAEVMPFLCHLHDMKYYATLSDFFRLVIINQFGGIYMDADTLPGPPATLFLNKPELPNFKGVKGEQVCWMNLFMDETGMIIAHRNNVSLNSMQQRLTRIYLLWEMPLPLKNARTEREIFQPFYLLWCEHLNISQISHQQFSERYAIVGFYKAQLTSFGIKGLRLLEDIFTGERCPLSTEEQQHYQHCVEALNSYDPLLNSPLDLESKVPLFSGEEIPRLARAPQLRAEIAGYHYYGVLSHDPVLDQMNQLFANYLIADNQRSIDTCAFWHPIQASPYDKPILRLKPGRLANFDEQRVMAKLMLTTSYLEYCSVDNLLGLDVISLQQQQNILPYLSTISLLYNAQGNAIGFVNAAPLATFSKISVDYAYREEVRALDEAYDTFVNQQSRDKDFFVASVAFIPQAQGKGYFSQLLIQLKQHAQHQALQRITLCVWASSPAVAIYLRKGFVIQGEMKKEVQRFADCLLFMALPV